MRRLKQWLLLMTCLETTALAADTNPVELVLSNWHAAAPGLSSVAAPAPRTGAALAWDIQALGLIQFQPANAPIDWSGYRFLSFWTRADGPTDVPLRVVVHSGRGYYFLTCPLPSNGWQQVSLPLNGFMPIMSPTGWNQIGKVELYTRGWTLPEPHEPRVIHLMDFTLTNEPVRIARPAIPVPVDPWYDLLSALYYTPDVAADAPGAFDFDQWRLDSPPTESDFVRTWNTCRLALKSAAPGATARIERSFNVNLQPYSELRLGGLWDPQAEIRVLVWEDNAPVVMHAFHSNPNPTQGQPCEMFRVPLTGHLLKKIALEIRAVPPAQAVAISPTFVQLRRKAANPALAGQPLVIEPAGDRTPPPPPRRSWLAKLLCRKSIPPPAAQPLRWGLVLRRSELPAFRAALQREPLAGLLRRQREVVDPYLKQNVAEEFNRATGGVYLRLLAHEYESPDQWQWAHSPGAIMTDAALLYLATGEKAYAELARQLLLAICRTRYWSNSFVFRFPQPEQAKSFPPFVEGSYAPDVALTMDWLSDYLTEAEIREAQAALAQKAIPSMEAYFQKQSGPHAFWRTTNQGFIFGGGLLMAAAVQDQSLPANAQRTQSARQRLDEVFAAIIPADGTCHEGLSYFGVSFVFGTAPLLLAANSSGQSFEELYGAKFRRAYEFIAYCRSTASRELRTLNFNDSRYAPLIGMPGIFFAKSQAAAWLMAQANLGDFFVPQFNISNLLFLSMCQPTNPTSPGLPLRRRFETSQTVFWRGGWAYGDSNFAFLSGPIVEGHHHADKNSFILEYGGERFLVDPGQISYSDSRATDLQTTRWHNTITIGEASQPTTVRDPAADLISYDDHQRDVAYLVSDATNVYPDATRVRRTILYSDTLGFLVCVDDVALKSPNTIQCNWQSLLPFVSEPAASAFRLTGQQAHLALAFHANQPSFTAQADTFTSDSGELHRLRYLSQEKLPQARLISVMAFGPRAKAVEIRQTETALGTEFVVHAGGPEIRVQVGNDDVVPGVPRITVQQTKDTQAESLFSNANHAH